MEVQLLTNRNTIMLTDLWNGRDPVIGAEQMAAQTEADIYSHLLQKYYGANCNRQNCHLQG